MDKIILKRHTCMGHHQGWKVWIDGVKYPREKGYFYTYGRHTPNQALDMARRERATGEELAQAKNEPVLNYKEVKTK